MRFDILNKLNRNLVFPQDKAQEIVNYCSVSEINKKTGLSRPTIYKVQKDFEKTNTKTILVLAQLYDEVVQALSNKEK